jgi:hypothetical protein
MNVGVLRVAGPIHCRRRQRASRIGAAEKRMDPLTGFGLFAVTAMLVCYALERKSPWFILGFAAACALGSVYGFLQGAWPFGVIEAIWSLIALWRWKHSK